VAAAVADGYPDRDRIALVLVTVWGVRLAGYIALRKRTHPGEDPRYTRMRRRAGNFVRFSLTRIFLLQAVLAWIVSIPLIGIAASDDGSMGPVVYVGVVLWAVGLFFEGVGDFQMSRFKADSANQGTVMNRGLWRYTRHPNYFGDFCIWWGLYAIAVDAGAWWSLPSPIIMTVLLTRVSGKDVLEKSMSKRPGYAEYVAATSGFVPMPPKG
jgi:steroid 5-alpha reductase family enzyme